MITVHQHYGTIKHIDIDERTVIIKRRNRKQKIYFQRAMFQHYLKYLHPNNILVYALKVREHPNKPYQKYTVKDVYKIVKKSPRKTITLYSYKSIVKQTQAFINSLDYKLFLDLEMSMHPYHVQKDFIQEVIQAGYVLVDKNDNVVETYKRFIQPTKHRTLTKRTLKFLKINQEDVDQGVPYKTFYETFKNILKTYSPAIIVWGKNDHLALQETSDVNDLPGFDQASRFINLLKLHKNVFRLKNDLGLITAYQLYGYEADKQTHDALEDALMTMHIFQGFKAYLNSKLEIDFSKLPKH